MGQIRSLIEIEERFDSLGWRTYCQGDRMSSKRITSQGTPGDASMSRARPRSATEAEAWAGGVGIGL